MSSHKPSVYTHRGPRPSMSLTQRVVLALVLVGLMPLAVSVYQIRMGREAIIRQSQTTHLVTARAAADRVAAFLELRRSLGAAIALHPDVTTDPGSRQAAEALTAFVWARDDLTAAGLFFVEDEPVLIQLARRTEDKEVVDQTLKVDDPRDLVATRLDDGRFFIRFRLTLADDDRLRLYLVADAKVLIEEFVPVELGEEAHLVLAGADGEVVAGQLDSLDGFPAKFLTGAAKLRSSAGEFEVGGERVVCAHADVAQSPWFVLSRQPSRVAESASAAMRRTAWQAFGAVGVAVVLLALAARNTIVRPIRRLARAQRRLAGSGDSQVGGGEIAELESSFAQLERHLNDREALSKVFLGRYQVIDVLGAGAMGTVFRGWDPRLQRYVALKTVKLDDEMEEPRREKLTGSLRKEAITLARLQHPHIVTVFDILEQGSVAFLAMELIEGVTLERYVWQQESIAADQLIPLGVAVFKALAAAHDERFVHQDVKPGNVLLGQDGAIKVTDFGIAEILSHAAKVKDVVVGTPGYLAPESLRGEGYTEKSDLFAAGVTLYECLTGRHPFPGASVRQRVLATLRTEVSLPSRLGHDVPSDFENLILRLMDKDPQQRPVTAAAVAAELEELNREHGGRWKPKIEGNPDDDSDLVTRRAHLSLVDTSRVVE